jgi:O-antigen/teichoic acid export membrane protein
MSKNHKKFLVNIIFLYIQRILAAALSLITTPLILKNLGVEDFGIYTLTIGVVVLVGFLNWSLSTATQRYISFSIGENNLEKSRKAFFSSSIIHFIYAFVFLIVLLIFYFIGVENFLNIPNDKILKTSKLLLIVSAITFFNILNVPLIGLVKAHDKFKFFSIVGSIDSLYKLIIAISLAYVIFIDKLLFYGFAMALFAFINFVSYFIYARKFKELSYDFKYFDINLIKEMMSFISWTLLGAFAILGRNQGVSVLINLFFGVIKNAAYGIALQVYAAVTILSQAISTSLNPTLVKSAGEKNYKKMIYMMETMSKFTFVSVAIFGIPLIIIMPFFLKIWLGTVPEDSVIFSRFIIISGLVMLLSAGIKSTFLAIKEVKAYNLTVSLILILNLPLSALLFFLGAPAYTIILVGIVLELFSFVKCHFLLEKYVEFNAKEFVLKKFTHLVFPLIVVTSFILIIYNSFLYKFYWGFVPAILMFVFFYIFITYRFSLDDEQKAIANSYLDKIKLKNKHFR